MNTTHITTTNSGFADRVVGFFKSINESRRRYATYRQTVRELDGLSDRELMDLGLHRAMIDGIAMEAAYGK